ncbi:unnamed protein product [Phytomonas sp. EM1]|nr:unnamed protein product [Phytomonas sp. EM1]|eukprot:CCW60371.1 unnamed protein product [Phytomonas sp. isolate EM1]
MASYHYIGVSELVELMDDPEHKAKLAVIDCRDADISEGFIVGSIHAPTISYTTDMYRCLAKKLLEGKIELAVFHCAMSQIRGPRGANRFALVQKELGLTLPKVAVLEGGWDAFYSLYGDTRRDLYCRST